MDAWANLQCGLTRRVVDSMSDRMQPCIDARYSGNLVSYMGPTILLRHFTSHRDTSLPLRAPRLSGGTSLANISGTFTAIDLPVGTFALLFAVLPAGIMGAPALAVNLWQRCNVRQRRNL